MTSPTPKGETNRRAVGALVLGILTFTCLGPLAAIPAIILGHFALKQIKQTPGQNGQRMAIAGLWLGYLGLFLSILASGYLVFQVIRAV